MSNYPEIEKLKAYFNQCKIEIEQDGPSIHTDYIPVILHLDKQDFQLQVDDEYGDFNIDNQVLCLFLVLNTLLLYKESDDFLIWCRQYGFAPANTSHLHYYQSLAQCYAAIENSLGEVDACIAPLDYQLRTGVIQALVELK